MAKNTTLLLEKLRGLMKSAQYGGPIQAYIIPSCDAHQVWSQDNNYLNFDERVFNCRTKHDQ